MAEMRFLDQYHISTMRFMRSTYLSKRRVNTRVFSEHGAHLFIDRAIEPGSIEADNPNSKNMLSFESVNKL
jgi:hypothetical protein